MSAFFDKSEKKYTPPTIYKLLEGSCVFIPNTNMFQDHYAGAVNLITCTAMVYEFYDEAGNILGTAISHVQGLVRFDRASFYQYKTPQTIVDEAGVKNSCLEKTVIRLYYPSTTPEDQIGKDIATIKAEGFDKIQYDYSIFPMCFIDGSGVLNEDRMLKISALSNTYLKRGESRVLAFEGELIHKGMHDKDAELPKRESYRSDVINQECAFLCTIL